MTDNVVKAGIEDVLSSVKRLVSEEGKTGKGADQGAKARKPGRLVLTDALRISKPAAAEKTPLKLEPEYSAAESAKPMLLRACDIVRDGAGDDKDTSEVAATEAKAERPDQDPTTSLSAKIEALEAAIARTEDQWEPDGDSDDAYSGTPNRSLSWDADAALAKESLEDAPEEQAEEAQNEAVQGTADSEEPEVEAPESMAPEAEEVQPAATFIRSAEAVPASETVEQDIAQVRELAVDEEALRSMIAEVVRQELKGALGERITRNVRKMVRREIYRALAAQELE